MSLFFPYSLGFFITGLVTLILGFGLTTIYSYNEVELDPKKDDRTKIRAVLITVIIIYLISIGYLMYVSDIEWEIQALIVQIFDQTYAFYPGFVVSSYQIFFPTLLLFGIFILPVIIVETGFLDDSPSKQINEQNNEISQKRELNLTSNRLVNWIRNITNSIKKYEFSIGWTFTIFGSLLIILPYFLLLDSPLKVDPLTGLEYHEVYYGFKRGQFLLIGLFFLIVGLILFFYYIRRRYSMKLD
ncbi:MAG: hypothetical protein P8Y18_10910 [Candidatus Bathyarchaeota archaeon]